MFSIFLPAGGSKGPHLHWNLFRSCCILFQVQFVFMIGRFGSILQVCMLFYYFWVMRVGFYGSYKINAFYWILYESLESCLLFLHCWIHASFIQRKTSANVPIMLYTFTIVRIKPCIISQSEPSLLCHFSHLKVCFQK